MTRFTDSPVLVFAATFAGLWLTTRLGALLLRKLVPLQEKIRDDFGPILAATLTLLGLIIGFSYTMATAHYDLRNTHEASEANAIRTEYLRAGLLPADDAAKLRALLRDYLDQRIAFHKARTEADIPPVTARTAQLQAALWSVVESAAAARQTSVVALAVSGLNDVFDAEGHTRAAWWNRVPPAAWYLMAMIAICCNLLIGYGARDARSERMLHAILPLLVSISFFLIADIDSPRGGIIRLSPQNLEVLAALKDLG
ncbi:MAG: hypothetical protein U1E53_34585 [Dongiaceae bacterium]